MKTFEYRLRPTKSQEVKLEAILSATCLLYNSALEELNQYFNDTGKYLNYFTQDKKHGKAEHPDLPAVLVDTTLQRLHKSFKLYFEAHRHGVRFGKPRFKSHRQWNSIDFRDTTNNLRENRFFAGRELGLIRVHVHRPLGGKFKRARIVKRPSGWYLQCICSTESQVDLSVHDQVGIDVGLKVFCADSNGVITDNPRCLKKALKKLRRLQRVATRRKKGSTRRKIAVRALAREHERITNRRKDFLHKISTKYVQNNSLIVVEDLNIQGMLRSRNFSRGVVDASWIQFQNMLAYKAESAGRQFIKVPARYTSQRCSHCGEMVQKSLSVRTHLCLHCGYHEDRDVNAARNILRLGQSLQESRGAKHPFPEKPTDLSVGGVTKR